MQYLIAQHDRYVWVTERQLVEIDIGDDIVHMGIMVWWEDGTSNSLATPYTGKVLAYDQDSGVHQLKYNIDSTEEELNLSTLELAPEFTDEGIRTMWILKQDHQGQALDVLALHEQLQTDMKKAVHHETVRVEKKKRKCDEDQVDRDTATARATIAAWSTQRY